VKSIYLVRAIPVRDVAGEIAGWVRADVLADGSRPTDSVFLRDGSMCGQSEGIRRVSDDRTLLYRTQAEAVRDGIARLRQADRMGHLDVPNGSSDQER
jgi:hypothetical protein